jgi:hypothetical protein
MTVMELECFIQIFEINIQMSKLMDIRPVRDELNQADGWTDKTNLIVFLYYFVSAPNFDIVSADYVLRQN